MAIELEQHTHINLQNDAYQTARLRRSTLVNLRWMAVAGQFVSALFIGWVLQIDLPLAPILSLIALSAAMNLIVMRQAPLDRRIGEIEAGAQLVFDVLQLCGLLYLTGGLKNPFMILLMAPVVVAARTMHRGVFAAIAALVALASVLLIHYHLPLPWFEAIPLYLPLRYLYGMWTALLVGMLFTAAYTWQANQQTHRMTKALAATDAVLAHEQKLTALGHLSAAAAHELGTPLATIQLVAKEMSVALAGSPSHKDDAELLLSQARRCRDILSNLSKHSDRTDDIYARIALDGFLEDIAGPFRMAGPDINIGAYDDLRQIPEIIRHPEIQYCLTTLIENAADFAGSTVDVYASWDADIIKVDIIDDGPGFDQYVLGRIGEPYISHRTEKYQKGGGMGLGLFISRTLIERRGGTVEFQNRKNTSGARVSIQWPNL